MAYQIQILGLRDYLDPKTNKMKKTETFHGKGWRVDNEEDIFQKAEQVVAKIPESERWNMYWTVSRCMPERGRILAEQHLLQFDLDDLEGTTTEELEANAVLCVRAACKALEIEYEKTGVIFSGNGVQFFIKLKHPILSEDYFDTVRENYGALLSKIKVELNKQNLKAKTDPSVFSAARLMRLPNTINKKKNKPDRIARVLQSNLEEVDFDVVLRSGIPVLPKNAALSEMVLRKYPTPDTKAVLAGCGFIKFCFEKPNEVKEYQWYAALSITARLDKGAELSHQMSEGYHDYNAYETDLKIEQALRAAGPRTCKNISEQFDGCRTCPHFNTHVVSPILISGPDHIKTKDTGFRIVTTDDQGRVKIGKPEYKDLIKQFEKDFNFIVFKDFGGVNVFNGKHWEQMAELEIKAWMTELVNPEPSSVEMSEFVSRLKARNLRNIDWLDKTTDRKMNFQNGVLDLTNMTLSPHSSEYGFTSVLPYNYDPTAKSPIWDKYIKDVANGDEKFAKLLEQFGGYAIAGGNCYAQKALVLLGGGGNGKSIYPETLAQVVGKDNYSALMLNHLNSDQMRYLLVNKAFNYGDESPQTMNTEMLKSLVTGADMTVKKVYETPYIVKNKAKFIILANQLPRTTDLTDGLYDRLLILPFTVKFRGTDKDDKQLKYKMWESELPGICNRLINGYIELVKNNFVFDEPEASIEMQENYREEGNNVLRFASDCLEVTQSEEDAVLISAIYSAYVSKCMFEQEKPYSKTVFMKLLRAMPRFAAACTKQKKVDGVNNKVLTNVKLSQGDF